MLGESLERCEVVGSVSDCVYCSRHARPTVRFGRCLLTEDPDGCRRVDGDVESGVASCISGDGHKSRIEADLASGRRLGQLLARAQERTLGHCVVLGEKFEGDGVANAGADVRRVESELAVLAHGNEVIHRHCGRGRIRSALVARVGRCPCGSGDGNCGSDSNLDGGRWGDVGRIGGGGARRSSVRHRILLEDIECMG